jgi:uncharacterized membrane protein (UPF0182 family)
VTRRARLTLLLVGLVALLFGGRGAAGVLTDRWWAARVSPGAAAFLTERHLLMVLLDLGAVLTAAAWFVGHLYIVSRAVGRVEIPRHVANVEFREAITPRGLQVGAVVLGLLLGLLAGGGAAEGWDTVELAWHGLRYGLAEPVLGQDIGFYVAQLPLWRALHGYGLVLALLAFVGSLTLYIVIGAVRWMESRPAINGHARMHLGWLLATVALTLAWGYLLEPYELVAGVAGPIDPGIVRLRTLVSPALAGTALAVAVLSGVWALRARHALMVASWLILFFASGLGHYVLPAVAHEHQAPVVPLEAARRFVGAAYGLDSLVDQPYPRERVDSAGPRLASLWDAAHAQAAINPDSAPLHALAPAIVRVGEVRRPAWLGVRPAGDGGTAVVALADDSVGVAGGPLFLRAGDSLPASRPAAYLELSAHALRPGAPAYDLGPNALGDAVGGWPRRVVLAWTLQIGQLLGGVAPDDRLAWRLAPADRLEHLAPFAAWGTAEPRLVRGELVWIAPGYLHADHFPLSPRVEWMGDPTGAVRAGFVGVVWARTGETHVYRRAGDDPLADAWAEIAAGVVEPASAMPPELRGQISYPTEIFPVQLEALERGAFGRALQLAGGEAGQRAPAAAWAADSAGLELTAGFQRAGDTLLAALVSARTDHGRDVLRLYRLDSTTAVRAPAQLARAWARFPLYAQLRDSVTAGRGEFETGPVKFTATPGGPVAYQSAFGRSEDGRLALVWMSVAAGPRLGAGRSLADAWENLRGAAIATPPRRDGRPAPRPDALAEAQRLMRRVDSAMRAGDWTRLGEALQALRELLGVDTRR